jgi:hypothetical protein
MLRACTSTTALLAGALLPPAPSKSGASGASCSPAWPRCSSTAAWQRRW